MTLLIAIPSKGRVDRVLKASMSYSTRLGHECKVFVEPQDASAYIEAFAELGLQERLVVLRANDQGLGYVHVAIKEYAQAHGFSHVFRLDDDIPYWSPGFGSAQENISSTPIVLAQALDDCLDLMARQPLLKAVGFNYKTFMHLAADTPMFSMNTRLQGCFVIDAASMYGNPRVSMWEDFYATLGIWVNGGFTARHLHAGLHWTQIGKEAGGLQTFDRVKMAEESLAIMRKMYPPLKLRRVDQPWGWEPDMAAVSRTLFRTPLRNDAV